MGYVNESLVVGRLGADPELTYSKAGMAVARLNIATHQKYMKGAQSITETEWHKAVVFGRKAEVIKEALEKGDSVYVKGVKRTSVYKDKDGQQRQKVEIIALDVKWEGSDKLDFTAPQAGGKDLVQKGQEEQRMAAKQGSAKPKTIPQLADEGSFSNEQIEKELADLRKGSEAHP